jgi:CheY-like chemotaxis protein
VAHELNNPLTAILGVSDLIRDRAADDVTRRQADIILKQARRAAGIVQNLLAFSRPSALASQKIHPQEILKRVADQHTESLRQKNISIEIKAAADLPFIEADPRLLQQVFVNLIANAEQAITAAKDRGIIQIALAHADGKVTFTFKDEGLGIPVENLSKIFDPFFTTKRPGGGTGLGLTIALAIAKEHGGSIDVDSVPGEGTAVCVILPALMEADAAAESATGFRAANKMRALPGSELLQGHSVYVVDDEESIREIVQEGLTARGMTVEGAPSSEEALAHLAHHTYDFIICDFNLPGQNGGQFFEKARALPRTANTKFIFMTGALLDTDITERFSENGAAMLQKPFHISALATLLTERIPQTSHT